MEERRKFRRLSREDKVFLTYQGEGEEARLLDVSVGGMRVLSARKIELGSSVEGKFQVIPRVGPFFIKGRVNWGREKDGEWEMGISFEKVSTLPIEN